MSTEIRAFSSADVCKLVGITPVYLNALVHRKLYGISPSISDRHGEMKLRLFAQEDVFGIAFVWMLFESGLRTQTIRGVLQQLVEIEDANSAVDYLSRSGPAHFLLVQQKTKIKGKVKHYYRAEPILTENLIELVCETIREHPTANVLVIPVGAKLAALAKKIAAMYGD